jgi:hypothetical protein
MNFLNEDNKHLLLGVIRNNHPITNEYHEEQLKYFFSSQSLDFDRTKVLSKSELLNVNKMYIAYIVNALKKNNNVDLRHKQQQQQPQSVTFINNTNNTNNTNDTILKPSMEGITAEELQNKKREQFNNELTKKQQEYSQLIQTPVPPTINFNEDKDTPISKMEELINQTIAQRALDVAEFKQIHLPPKTQENQQNMSSSFLPLLSSSSSSVNNTFSATKLITINKDVIDISSESLKPIILESNKNISFDHDILDNRLNILEDKIDTIIQLLRTLK